MRKSKKVKENVLATLSEEDRLDYAHRMRLVEDKKKELAAATYYLDLIGEQLKEKYDLPTAYNLELSTGKITAVEEVENA